MRRLLKQAVCFGLTAAMTLGMCSSAFANGGATGGGGSGSATGTTPSGGTKLDNTWKPSERGGLCWRFYLATYGDVVEPSCGWDNINEETIKTATWSLINFKEKGGYPARAAHFDTLAERNKAIYYVRLPSVRNGGFVTWHTGKKNMVAVDPSQIVALNVNEPFPEAPVGVDGLNGHGMKFMTPYDFSASCGDYITILDKVFGDSAGKWPSLVAAMQSVHSEGAKFQEVVTDALKADSVYYLSQDEVQEHFRHYIKWWVDIFTTLQYPSNAISVSEIQSKLEEGMKEAKKVVGDGKGGPSSSNNIGPGNPKLQDVVYATENFKNYPCIVIEPLVVVAPYNTNYVPIAVPYSAIVATGGMRSTPGDRSNVCELVCRGITAPNNRVWPSGGNIAAQHFRSGGTMFMNKMIERGDFTGTGNMSSDAGILSYGFYGALLFETVDRGTPKDPEDPPPENPPPPPPNDPEVDGDLADFLLMDYEINHVFDSIAEKLRKGNGSHTWMKLGTDQHTVSGEVKQQVDCAGDHGPWDDYDTTLYYEVDYQENAASGPSISMDDSGTKLFLKNNGKYGDTWFYRDEIKGGQTLDTRNVADYTVDYAFNLLRRHFKDDDGKPDNRIYSLLVEQKVTKDYLDNVLGMYEGMIPKDIARVEEPRNSMARLRAIQDSMSWTSKFNVTGRQVAYDTESKSHSSRYYDGCDDCSGHPCHASWNALKDGPALQGYVVGGSGYAEYSWDIISLAHKYRTKVIPEGYVPTSTEHFDYRETDDQDGGNTTPEDDQYRSSTLISTETTLEYYPEVPMLGDEVPGPDLTHEYKPIITIGEEKRKTRTPMLLLYRLESASPDVTGTVYTDTAVGGSSYLGTNKVALTAGGDFTVKADTKMTINLYGYAMDIIEPSDPSYAEVTRSNDVKAAWGDMTKNRENLLKKYTEWAGVMLNPNSYQADFEMLSGGKKYNSFSATVGGFTTRASNSKEEGSYPLVFKHGDIDKTAQGYKDFIKQLAQDYACSEAEADALFEASEMKQAVIKSIEHDNSSENKSQAQTIGRDQVQLGSSSHWYDEEVRTIVMRRFMTPQGTFKDIIAQDKMDIGNAMEGNAIQNGQFRLTLWFNDNVYTKSFETTYIPSTGSSNKSATLANGNIILCGLHVSGADFQLTRSTTATGKH